MTISKSVRRARDLLLETGMHEPPIDVAALAAHLGVRVVSQTLEDAISGVLVIRDDQAAIGVNEGHHRNRQRFTIAHELGHYLLHHEESTLFVDSTLTFYRDATSANGRIEQEIEANTFAAEILMPSKFLRQHLGDRAIDLHDDVAVSRLAARFGVSAQALTIRLINLKLVSA